MERPGRGQDRGQDRGGRRPRALGARRGQGAVRVGAQRREGVDLDGCCPGRSRLVRPWARGEHRGLRQGCTPALHGGLAECRPEDGGVGPCQDRTVGRSEDEVAGNPRLALAGACERRRTQEAGGRCPSKPFPAAKAGTAPGAGAGVQGLRGQVRHRVHLGDGGRGGEGAEGRRLDQGGRRRQVAEGVEHLGASGPEGRCGRGAPRRRERQVDGGEGAGGARELQGAEELVVGVPRGVDEARLESHDGRAKVALGHRGSAGGVRAGCEGGDDAGARRPPRCCAKVRANGRRALRRGGRGRR
mmetsp:Transcript_126899/g.367284  ORF Transcript_126899/g.367284 Transcript_126899/m.367284 type:complete len:301 (-) Transcript_126899:227-1129(-)